MSASSRHSRVGGNPEKLITENLDIWTNAIKPKAAIGRGRGKGSNGKHELYGIKKLRELILELAVRGELVPQDPNDEPASVVLEKIAAEKKKLIKEKKIKKQKLQTSTSDEEKPFNLPKGWEWTYIAEIAQISPRNEVPGDVMVSFVPMPLITINYDGSHEQEIRKWSEIKKGYTHFADGDIAIAKITPCFENSKAAIFSNLENGVGAGTTELHIARPFGEFQNRKYILLYLKAPQFLAVGETKMTGSAGQKRVPKDFFAFNPLPFPPLKEQQQTDSIDAHKTLVETLLGTLTSVESQKECEESWHRIANHFDTLFTTENSIDQLKQTILKLAVMGKLVPQNPNDKPAINLLKDMFSTRDSWLIENKKENKECATMLRKLKKLGSAKPPFSIPDSWECIHLIQACQMLVDCHNKTAPYVDDGIPIIRTSNIRERRFRMGGIKFVNQDTYEYWSRRCPPEPNDIIFTREAPMGEAAIIPDGVTFCLGQRTMLIRTMHAYMSADYLLLALTEPHLLERASEHAIGSTVKHLRVGDVENLNIPIPPLEEQYRIVAKVDELLALCDALKARINDAQTTQAHLADAIVEQAIA